MSDRTSPGYPDGLEEKHSAPPRGVARHASPLSMALLGTLMIAAISGVLGGKPKPILAAAADAARLEVKTPAAIRNGEFFETRITVVARRPIEDLVIGVTPSLWRDITVNTMIPAPAEESFAEGAYRFSYGRMEPGQPLVVKIDSQINPSLFRGTAGEVTISDGEQAIVALPIRMRVLP